MNEYNPTTHVPSQSISHKHFYSLQQQAVIGTFTVPNYFEPNRMDLTQLATIWSPVIQRQLSPFSNLQPCCLQHVINIFLIIDVTLNHR